MGKAGNVLKQVLESFGITQYGLAKAMGVERTTVYRWVKGDRDPAADTVVEIVEALKLLNREAAEEFVRLYLGTVLTDEDS
jgi:transcriptional regulator with XRE-family HTH domain